jgi:hypothetical protein
MNFRQTTFFFTLFFSLITASSLLFSAAVAGASYDEFCKKNENAQNEIQGEFITLKKFDEALFMEALSGKYVWLTSLNEELKSLFLQSPLLAYFIFNNEKMIGLFGIGKNGKFGYLMDPHFLVNRSFFFKKPFF